MIDPNWAAGQLESLEQECSRLRAENERLTRDLGMWVDAADGLRAEVDRLRGRLKGALVPCAACAAPGYNGVGTCGVCLGEGYVEADYE